MIAAVTYVKTDVLVAEQVSLYVRSKVTVRSPSSAFCAVPATDIWFPLPPGATEPPSGNIVTTNPNPKPANSVPIPEDLDDQDLCYIFQDLLPTDEPPVYANEILSPIYIEPYNEILPLEGVTRTLMSVREYPYELTLPSVDISLVTKAEMLLSTVMNADVGDLALSGQQVQFKRSLKMTATAGAFSTTGYSSGFLLNQLIGANVGTFNAAGQSAGLLYQRLPLTASTGAFTLTGQDAGSFLGKTIVASAGSFSLAGQAAGSIRNIIMTANTGNYTVVGKTASLGLSDPSFSSVVMLLHMDGTDGSTSFVDSSSSAKSITVSNATISTTEWKFGNSSGLFNGTSARLEFADSDDWNIGGGDFTMETFVRFASVSASRTFISQRTSDVSNYSFNWAWSSANQLQFRYTASGGTEIVRTFSWTPSTNTWYHVALVRSGSSLYSFVDGTQVGTTASITTTIFNSTQSLIVGAVKNDSTFGTYMNGNLDEMRFTKGVARYTSNFTAPTAPFPNF